ncbi:MAG: hypothetical protein DRG24_06075 [Epsilonproteobacteria bacterium]|nr:MAG: hypothetical protein DRG24_06075 [Campylobacterota bacterium]
MSYLEWFENHALKHQKIIRKLLEQGLSEDEIIDYFDFDNMITAELNFCPLYADNKKCHDMEQLNCYLCACPNFRFNDKGFEKNGDKTVFSHCNIESKDGRQGIYGDSIHQDCSGCTVPHHRSYVKKHFNIAWKEIMKACHPQETIGSVS